MGDAERSVFWHDWFDRLGGVTPIQGNLYRSPIPVAPHHFDALSQAGVRVVYSFEEDVAGDALRARGFDWRPHFWTDDEPPPREAVHKFLDDYLKLPETTRALVHCRAGFGRAGTAATCALIAKHDWPAARALDHFWSKVPGARRIMEGNGQAEFVHGFAAARRGRGLP